jgi:hypothetical protein
MIQALRIWPLLNATHLDDRTMAPFNGGHGQTFEAPHLAYPIETRAAIHRQRIEWNAACSGLDGSVFEDDRLEDAVAPGSLRQGREQKAVDSIRQFQALARETSAHLWPDHNMNLYRGLPSFSRAVE